MVFGNAAAERRALEATYEDAATVFRAETEAAGAIDRVVPVLVAEGVPCGLSRKTDSSRQTGAQQDVDYDCVMFVAPEVPIRPGARVDVTRFGELNSFETVGKPVIYATHQEVFLKGRELA